MLDLSKTMRVFPYKTIGIAGVGGLGSNCAAALVRSGVGKIILADFDRVSKENLDRQFFFASQVGMPKVNALAETLLSIHPPCPESPLPTIVPHFCKVTPQNVTSLFGECDAVVEAFDEKSEKQWFIEYFSTHHPTIPLVCGSGIAGIGNLNNLKVKKYGNLYVCGDQSSETNSSTPPFAPRVGIVALMQADTILKILLENDNNTK